MDKSDLKINKKAYEYLYILENELRELIVKGLTEKSSENNFSGWITLIQRNIIQKWEKRKSEEDKNYQRISSSKLIDYSEFGDIKLIIQKNWDEFSKIFTSQEIIASKLDELEQIRNTIAHNRELSLQEFKRLEIYLSDIEKILSKK